MAGRGRPGSLGPDRNLPGGRSLAFRGGRDHRNGVWGGKPPALAVGRQSPTRAGGPIYAPLWLATYCLIISNGAPPAGRHHQRPAADLHSRAGWSQEPQVSCGRECLPQQGAISPVGATEWPPRQHNGCCESDSQCSPRPNRRCCAAVFRGHGRRISLAAPTGCKAGTDCR